MSRKIFVNLPVTDLKMSMDFFAAVGFTFNPQFTDHTAACMVISEEIYSMLLTREKFQGFSPNPICDATKSNEVCICLSCETREEVGETVAKALAAGAKRFSEPMDYGFMIQDGFQDLDGHVWEFIYMDPSHVQ